MDRSRDFLATIREALEEHLVPARPERQGSDGGIFQTFETVDGERYLIQVRKMPSAAAAAAAAAAAQNLLQKHGYTAKAE